MKVLFFSLSIVINVPTIQKSCCSGYYGDVCDSPKCGKGDFTSCNLNNEGMVIYRNRTIVTNSGGTCVAPNTCKNCNKGFYPNNSVGKCKACPTINHCNVHQCNNTYDVTCQLCQNEFNRDELGSNEYTGAKDRKQCTRTCSWVRGYRCYPGVCNDNYYRFYDTNGKTNCVCAKGFGGIDCATSTHEYPMDLLEYDLELRECENEICHTIIVNASKNWSNEKERMFIDIKALAEDSLELPNATKYIIKEGTKLGLQSMHVVVSAFRGQKSTSWVTKKDCKLNRSCRISSSKPISETGLSFINNGFLHGDRIVLNVRIRNGGIIYYQRIDSRTQNPVNESYYVNGIEKNYKKELEFDMADPSHCKEIDHSCINSPLWTSADFVTENKVTVSWEGWTDKDSGIYKYQIELYLLVKGESNSLRKDHGLTGEAITRGPSVRSAEITVEQPGPYAVELTTFDHAGNHKTARRLFLFDDNSEVSLNRSSSTKILSVNDVGWIDKDTESIIVDWAYRFSNNRHHKLCWLCRFDRISTVVPIELDDTVGLSERSLESIQNIQGIVRFELAYLETYEGKTTSVPAKAVTSFEFNQQQVEIDDIALLDGKRVEFTLRGYDIMDAYAEDNTTVWIDTSPPVIENLWLTRGDIVNISVHNVTELAVMRIEWNAFDVHSGLYEISWRLFDNFSRTDIVHGHSYESPQHGSKTLTECEQEYANYARGSNCYCSPYNGCFHQHFQVIPPVINFNTVGGFTQLIGGIDGDKSEGVHESEYYIEVTAVNNAGLTTVRDHKITIDVSPPNPGHVHDGVVGQPEVDFQQSLTLNAHWDDFLDKESGIKFYVYCFKTRCLTADEMHFDRNHPEIVQTYSTTASTTVQSPGRYYTTVVAYNHALDPSVPVCSDGVVIDSTPTLISEVVIHGGIATPRIVRDIDTDEIFFLNGNREIQAIRNPTNICWQTSFDVPSMDIQMIPKLRNVNGSYSSVNSTVCGSISSVSRNIVTYVRYDSHLDISWNYTEGPSGVNSFDIGLSSDNTHTPDIMSFQSSMHHSFMRLVHPGIWDGQEFFILLKVTTKSGVFDTKAIGPVMVVKSKPEFTGSIHINTEENFLVASWGSDDFVDHGESGDLKFEIAVGSSRFTSNVLPFSAQRSGGSCEINDTISCTAVDMRSLKWALHENADYYVAVKATDPLGLFVVASSEKYTHYYELPSSGVVYDIDIHDKRPFVDIDDIDFQSKTSELAVRWNGFYHPHSDIQFKICVQDRNGINIVCETATSDDHHAFYGLGLRSYERYYQEVTAMSATGNVSVLSDGVVVVIPEDEHTFEVFDGNRCNGTITKDFYTVSHYTQFDIFNCTEDIDYQYQTSSLNAYWWLPEDKRGFMQTILWRIEERALVVDMWTPLSEYQILRNRDVLHVSGLYLIPGRKYRISVKACARQFCFKSMSSDGVFIIPNPPVTGSLSVNYDMRVNTIAVTMDGFKDSDIEDVGEALSVIMRYEYAFADEENDSKLLNKWEVINITSETETKISFDIILDQKIRFAKCWKLAIKGITKAGTYTIISSEIRNCSYVQEVKPSIVIDAVGKTIGTQDGQDIGGETFLEQNHDWSEKDKDYTSFTNIISAVWPKLRYKHYNWAVLSITNEDPTIFYDINDHIDLRYPCTHPETIACGETDKEYMNANFDSGVLKHGKRYIVCIHANETYLYHEKWTQHLDEFMECSDGVTVDITPPIAGKVWIGQEKNYFYQTSTSDILVMWNSFSDIEEHQNNVHESGIAYYAICLGSSPGGNDVTNLVNVGLVNHKVFHNLLLQNGLSYYATVKGFDYVGLSTSESSHYVVVDSTPPKVTGKSIQISSRHLLNTTSISACWKNVFEDTESGINRYEWSVGTSHGYEDVLAYTTHHEDCAESELSPSRELKDGHSYFITVKAYNNAGLFSTDTSWAFVVDTTPPDSGLVYDGPNDGTYTDIDYMTSSNTVQAYWTHFIDAHTPVREYFVSVGTCKECDDVLTEQSVGIKNEIKVDGLALMEGRVYYTTVKACNTAMLCSRASSDGFLIDKSPPTRGTVIDGLSGSDIDYQASRSHVGCKWFGFSDPQSGLSHYVWRLGTVKDGDDIVSATNVHNHEIAYIFDVQSIAGTLLPVGKLVYCTVRAYNKAGFFTEMSSNGFVVDTSPPRISKELALSPFGRSISHDRTTILRSSLRVHWDTSDSDSGISAQYLSLSSHIGGDFNVSTVKVDAVATEYTLLNLDLHDGSYYDIKLTVCNGAKLCTQSLYSNLLVDSTPPTMGTFAITTDHASELGRQPENWMKWNPIMLNISWLGFEDIHSGIDMYIINVGTRYMANDLNKNGDSLIKVKHVNIGFEHQEGFVQTYSVRTKSLSNRKSVYVSVFAINAVGLHSPILHAQFNLLFGGLLSIVRRCDAETCLGHCVCAPVPARCHYTSTNCTAGNSENVNGVLIRDRLDIDFTENHDEVQYSPFDTFLAAYWTVVDTGKSNPQWYEWSIGESNEDEPMGVFDQITDRVWHDAGSHMSWMYTLPRGQVLQRTFTYSFFVRAWYDDSTFSIFKSSGVTILSKPPQTAYVRGVSVKEVLFDSLKDVDYISDSNHVMIDWTEKFIGEFIKKFHLYLSTQPNGKDVHVLSTYVNASVTKYDIIGANLKENKRYFSVVQAVNYAGLYTTLSSDGFMLDVAKPETGTVNDGIVLHDVQFLNSSNQLPSFWYGFSDSVSGIDHYEHCVSSLKYKGRCDIQPLINVGLRTFVERKSEKEFIQGENLFNEVCAYDMAGHVSDLVASDGVLIDRTPPLRVTYVLSNENIVRNGSFENTDDSSLQCDELSDTFWYGAKNSCLKVIKAQHVSNGNSFLLLQGNVSQEILVDDAGKYRLQFFTSNIPRESSQLSVQDGYFVINEIKHVFQMHTKPSSEEATVWQEQHYVLNLQTGRTTITFGTENSAHFGIDDISLRVYSGKAYQENSTDVKHLQAFTIHAHDWSSIYSEWHFEDPESGIIEYLWAIGTVRGGTQLQEYTSVGRNEFASSNTIQLQHNTVVFVSVMAVNGAGLRTVSYSETIYIDLTPPLFDYIHDGDSSDFDIQFQTSLNVSVAWSVKDLESKIQECVWAIGLYPTDLSIKDYTQIGTRGTASTVLYSKPYDRIFSTIRCKNAAGRIASVATDGLRILNISLTTHDAYISLMAMSQTQYPIIGSYHGNNTEVKFQWAGFRQDEGINNFLISLGGVDTSYSETVIGSTSDVNFAGFTGMDLADGFYEISVQAVNEIHMYSEKKTIGFYLLTSKPTSTGKSVKTTWDANTLIAKAEWSNVFDSTHPLYYEVTVRQEHGEGNILQWQETVNTALEVKIQDQDVANSGSTLKFSIRAINHAGYFNTVHADLFVLV